MLWRSVSIHASAKEATGAISAFVTTIVFQSTPPRRRRLNCILLHLCLLVVSIHASAKEATESHTMQTSHQKFQSTPPRRRRLDSREEYEQYSGFNPRLREGGDRTTIARSQSDFRFQSTPPRRRRQYPFVLDVLYAEFQSTPPRRRRPFPGFCVTAIG